MLIMSRLIKLLRGNCFQKVLTIYLSLFCGYLALLFSFVSIIRNRSKFFQVKRRDVPPDCLNDPSLGTHQLVQLKNIRVHLVQSGDKTKPLMLFIHGFPEFWYSWRHQIKEFSNDFFVVAIDLRGYGETDKPNGIHNYTTDKMAEDIKQLLEVLDKKDVILVGHDWGGVIAWHFAAKHRELVSRLIILNSPHPLMFRKVIRKSWKQYFSSFYMFFFNLPLLPELIFLSNDLRFFEDMFASADGHPICTDEDIEAYKYVFSKPNSLTAPLNYYRAMIRKYPTVNPISYQIKVPTLIIWGKRDIALVPQLAEAFEFVDNLTVKYIENCSHWTQMDQPLVVNQYIRQFVD